LRRGVSGFRVEFKPLIYERPSTVRRLRTFHFSKLELKHLGVAMLIVGLIFSWGKELAIIPPVVVAVLLGFIIHEVAHKLAAQKHGLQAEFRINPMLALISLISIALPVKFVAPGAVVIWGPYITRRIEAEISSAGPLTNIVIAFIGLAVRSIKTLGIYGYYILLINSFLALFNLLPLPMFDGGKLFQSDLRIWLALFSLSLLLFMFSVL
jgi:Zn-dependent protease